MEWSLTTSIVLVSIFTSFQVSADDLSRIDLTKGRKIAALIQDQTSDEAPSQLTAEQTILDEIPGEANRPILLNLSIGTTSFSYSGDVKSTIEVYKNQAKFNQSFPIATSVGVYAPINHQWALGGAVELSRDRYVAPFAEPGMELITYNVFHQALALSLMGSPSSSQVGKGFLLRGDLGISRMSYSQKDADSAHSDIGFHSKAGMGAGVDIGNQTSLLLMGSFTYRRIEKADFSLIGLDVGILF